MTSIHLLLLSSTTLALISLGCAKTRSISNPGYPEISHRRAHVDAAFAYRGELSEFDLLEVNRSATVDESEIHRALDQSSAVKLRAGSGILLIQSGAVFPDAAMVEQLSARYQVTPFSGLPPQHQDASEQEPPATGSYARTLRLAAARTGAETIVCYWGVLESARRNLETKTVSWIPLAGWMVPDEAQQMRIRLKLAVIDVRTGAWRIVCPEASTDKAWSNQFTRGSSDQKQVEQLKARAYAASMQQLAALDR